MKIYFNAHNTHHTPRFFLWLENVVIPNYNKCSKLTCTQKIEDPLSTRVSACLEASIYIYIHIYPCTILKIPLLSHVKHLPFSSLSLFLFLFFFNLFHILGKKKKDSYYKTTTIISPSISLYLGTNISDFERN